MDAIEQRFVMKEVDACMEDLRMSFMETMERMHHTLDEIAVGQQQLMDLTAHRTGNEDRYVRRAFPALRLWEVLAHGASSPVLVVKMNIRRRDSPER